MVFNKIANVPIIAEIKNKGLIMMFLKIVLKVYWMFFKLKTKWMVEIIISKMSILIFAGKKREYIFIAQLEIEKPIKSVSIKLYSDLKHLINKLPSK